MTTFRTFRALGAAAFLALALAATPAVAETARRIPTHEDIWLLKRVGSPTVSPNGRWVVFSVVEPAYDRKDQKSDLWVVAVDGRTPPHRLTSTSGGEGGVAWSPDGKRLAFSAKREGDSDEQIYLLELYAAGEAQRITNAALGARTPKFSPDGTKILYVADAWPGAKDDADNRRLDKERKDRKYDVRVYETFPIRNWDKWLDERQARLYVQSLEPGAEAKDLFADSTLLREKGYAGRTEDDGIKLDPVWAPDGKGIVFVASTDRNRAAFAFTTNQLWYAPLDGGEPRALTAGADSWGEPKFSADGRTLYAEWSPGRKSVYTSTRIAAFDWSGRGTTGPSRNLTSALDRSATSWGVSSNGTLWYLAEDAGHEKLHVVEPGKPARLAFDVPVGVYTGLSVASTSAEPVLVARWESVANPPQVVRIDPAKGHETLTSFDMDKVAALDLPPVEHFSFKARATGRQIHNMVVRPPGFDPAKKYPLFVMIHGGPANMWRDQFFLRWNYHLIASGSGASTPGASRDGYVLVLTNYTGSTGFGEKFGQAIQNDPLKGPGAEVNEAADVAIAKYPFIDGSRQCAGGASYGGHLSNWLQATTTRYKCLVSHAGLIDLRSQWGTSDAVYHREVMVGGPPWENGPLWKSQSPLTYAAKFRTPVLVTVGERDFRVPLNNTLEYWTTLQRQQVPARLVVYPGENHWIQNGENSKVFYRDIADWLAKYLQAGGTSK